MNSLRVALLAGVAALLALPGPEDVARADRGERSLKAELDGFEEPPAVSTTGSGEFRVRIGRDESSFEYKLSYEDLEGTVTSPHPPWSERGQWRHYHLVV